MIQKQLQKACGSIMPKTLYVVATPIGNLADITLRALAVLQNADLICAEDTRVTARLLSAYGIQGRLVSVHEHNERQMAASPSPKSPTQARPPCATPAPNLPGACAKPDSESFPSSAPAR